MDFTFTEDQKLFADNIRSIFLKEVAPELLREQWETETGRSDTLWQLLAEQGLTAFSVPEAAGGLGLGDVDWVLIAQEVGYFGLPEPLLDTAWLGVALLRALPDSAAVLRDEWLSRIAEGSARIAIGGPLNPLVADAHVADLLLLHLAEALLFKGALALFLGHLVQFCLTLLIFGKSFSLGLRPHFKKVRNTAPHNDDTKQTQQNEANQLLRHLHLLQPGIGLS